MFRLFNFFVIILILYGACPAMAEILFYENCENEPSPSNWRSVVDGDAKKSFSVSSEQAKAGIKSWKYSIGAGEKNSHNEHRLLAAGLSNFPYNKEFWIGYSVFIPSSVRAPTGWPEWGLVAQFHGTPDSIGSCDDWRNPILGAFIATSELGYNVTLKSQSATCSGKTYDRAITSPTMTFGVNTWHNVVMNIKFNHSTPGITRIWVDGVLAIDDTGPNCFNDVHGPYMMFGPYAQKLAITMYVDEIRIGDASSSYNEVSPTATSALLSGDESPILEPPQLRIGN